MYKNPNGSQEFPARTCRDLHMSYPKLRSGEYFFVVYFSFSCSVVILGFLSVVAKKSTYNFCYLSWRCVAIFFFFLPYSYCVTGLIFRLF